VVAAARCQARRSPYRAPLSTSSTRPGKAYAGTAGGAANLTIVVTLEQL
jgi:hypothetical protein